MRSCRQLQKTKKLEMWEERMRPSLCRAEQRPIWAVGQKREATAHKAITTLGTQGNPPTGAHVSYPRSYHWLKNFLNIYQSHRYRHTSAPWQELSISHQIQLLVAHSRFQLSPLCPLSWSQLVFGGSAHFCLFYNIGRRCCRP